MFDRLNINIAGGLDIPLPPMAGVQQQFANHGLVDVSDAVAAAVNNIEASAGIKPGDRIAVGVGSRGISNLAQAVRALVDTLKAWGAHPFIFPAMGSHGGATAAGQAKVLASYGVTEARMGVPIRATMDTVLVTHMADGTPLYMDQFAHEADGVVLINRIKPHTTVRGNFQSGIVKMMIIGMGKIQGATIMHGDHGMDTFDRVLPKAAEALMPHIPFRFGVALLEDAYDHTSHAEALLPDKLLEREKDLLNAATAMMARLHFDQIDVLVIDQIGKEISGSGFDPNIAGRNSRGVHGFDKPEIAKLVLLGLTEQTYGNATGIGLADVITQQLFNNIDFASTYANVITSAYLDGAAVPIVMPNSKDAVSLAVKTVLRVKPADARIVRIRDTLSLDKIFVSEPMLPEVTTHASLTLKKEPAPMQWTPAEFSF
ncbi:MAG: DUF362 domain-containing protein [Bacteroidota bacterium]